MRSEAYTVFGTLLSVSRLKPRGATRAEIPYALAEINLEIIGNQVEISGNQLEKSEACQAASAQAHGKYNWKSR